MPASLHHRRHPLATAVVLALAATGAQAATITVMDGGDSGGMSSCTLRQAIDSVNSASVTGSDCINGSGDGFGTNDTIVFDATLKNSTITLGGSQLEIDKPVRIEGYHQTIDAGGNSRVLYVKFATLQASSLNVTGGVAYSGGGILAKDSTVTLTNVTVSGNTANDVSGGGGGGVAASLGSLTLVTSGVTNNSSSGPGGGISGDHAALTLANSSVDGNSANGTKGGGGVAASYGSLEMNASEAKNNSTSSYGGGVSGESAALALTNSAVFGNAANVRGGGVVVGGGSATFEDGTLVNGNSAPTAGGIDAEATVTLTDATVSGNTATTFGAGGMRLFGTATLTNTTISGNLATLDGGGIFSQSGSATLTNTSVSDNTAASGRGGGIYAEGGTWNLTNVTLSGNSAEGSGGGMYSYENGEVAVLSSGVYSNIAGTSGGGIEARCEAIMLAGTLLSGNTSGSGGGALHVTDHSHATIDASKVSGNSAGSAGGGVAADLGTSLTLVDTTLAGNSAYSVGGGLDVDHSEAFLANSTFRYNQSGGAGGIYSNSASLTATNLTLANNDVSGFGGGLATNAGSLTLANTILSGNTATLSYNDFFPYGSPTLTVESSLLGARWQMTFPGNGNVFADDPMLAAMADNGGPTPTAALLEGSPALDAGDPALALAANGSDPLNYDQRGRGFPRTLSGMVDIGAFQHQPTDRIFADGNELEP